MSIGFTLSTLRPAMRNSVGRLLSKRAFQGPAMERQVVKFRSFPFERTSARRCS